MKHYIEIENVGPIKKAKIDLSKYVVLIGPQASGKSIIAKLIAIFRGREFFDDVDSNFYNSLENYGLKSFVSTESHIKYTSPVYIFNLKNDQLTKVENQEFETKFSEIIDDLKLKLSLLNQKDNEFEMLLKKGNVVALNKKMKELEDEYLFQDNKFRNFFVKPSIYIPAERIIISLLSQSIYSLIKNKINLPQLLLDFAANYELARNEIKEYNIKFLKANYSFKNGKEILEINKQETLIAEAASGFQTLIPMLLVCEFFLKDKLSQTYIIEEPELNLFPTAQKDLIYHLINIINNSYSKEQNTSHDLVMTTHSPYILASLNNLLLAGKIKEEQPIKFTKAKKIVNGDYYISKNDLNVYALKNGKAKSIISKETGLIAENELDHVSEEINYEFNALKNLYFESAN